MVEVFALKFVFIPGQFQTFTAKIVGRNFAVDEFKVWTRFANLNVALDASI